MLLAKGKITREIINMLDTWEHSWFTVFCGNRIYPHEDTAMENLARYIIRASFSQERMTYLRDESKVIYKAKKGGETKTFAALEWLAAMFPTGGSRWSGTMAGLVMSAGAIGKRKKLILQSPLLLKLTRPHRQNARLGRG